MMKIKTREIEKQDYFNYSFSLFNMEFTSIVFV